MYLQEGREDMNESQGSIGICGVLTIVFIVLKLVGVIAWSWWVVLLPLIIPCALLVVLVAVKAILLLKVNKNEKHSL